VRCGSARLFGHLKTSRDQALSRRVIKEIEEKGERGGRAKRKEKRGEVYVTSSLHAKRQKLQLRGRRASKEFHVMIPSASLLYHGTMVCVLAIGCPAQSYSSTSPSQPLGTWTSSSLLKNSISGP
jgi:hypothetical protein